MNTFSKIKMIAFLGIILMGMLQTNMVRSSGSIQEEDKLISLADIDQYVGVVTKDVTKMPPKRTKTTDKNSFGEIKDLAWFRGKLTDILDVKVAGRDRRAISKRRKALIKLFNETPVKNANEHYFTLTDKKFRILWAADFNRKISSSLRNKLLNILRKKMGMKTRTVKNKSTNQSIKTSDNSSCSIDPNNGPDDHYYQSLDAITEALNRSVSVRNKRAIAERRVLLNCLFEQFPPLYLDHFREELGEAERDNNISRVFHRRLSNALVRELLSKLGQPMIQRTEGANRTLSTKIDKDSFEHIRTLIWNNLSLEAGGWGDGLAGKLAERPARLVRVFKRVPLDAAWDFHSELGAEDNGGEFSTLFHSTLSFELRAELIDILWHLSEASLTQQSGGNNRTALSNQTAVSYENIREIIWNQLLQEIGKENVADMNDRRERLVRAFNRVPKDSAWAFYSELGVEDNGGEFSKIFHSKLSYQLRDQLLGILWERAK